MPPRQPLKIRAVAADNVRVNAKVDYTLLDRWRFDHARPTCAGRTQLEAAAAPAAGRERDGNGRPELRDEDDGRSARVIHMPLAD